MLLELKDSCKEGFPDWLCLSILLAVMRRCPLTQLPPCEQSLPKPERLGGQPRQGRSSPFPADQAVREAAPSSLEFRPARPTERGVTVTHRQGVRGGA